MDRNLSRPLARWVHSIVLVVSVLSLDVIAQETRAIRPSPPTYPSVIIPNTELRTIRSKIVNQQFDISILLPPGYMADSTAVYPALYMTDANYAFPMVANIASVLAFPKTKSPEMIIVGIGYPIRDMADWAAWRTRDLTPTQDTATDNSLYTTLEKMSGRKYNVRSGGAPRFLEFIIKELMPFIESNYRVSRSDRGLAGYSYGGLFALYALFSYPEVFQRYFAGSPSLAYDNEVLFRLEDEFAASGRRIRAKVFLSAGSLEDSSTVSLVKKMRERLTSRYAPDLQVSSYLFDGEDHRSCAAAAVMRAFRVLYGQ